MILIFNKQYRQEKGLIDDLKAAIKKSKKMEKDLKGNTEIYKLDTIKIHFDVLTCCLKVMKNEPHAEVIADLDCKFVNTYSDNAELQRKRFEMFSGLLETARQTYNNKIEKAAKLENATKKILAEKTKLDRAAAEAKAAQTAIVAARQKLKSL